MSAPLVLLYLFLLVHIVCSDQFEYDTFSNTKGKIKFKKYSTDQKTRVLTQAIRLLQIYVNRQSKIENYGTEIDPIPRLERLLASVDNLPDEQMHMSIATIFANLRDFHTRYYLPAPHACISLVNPLKFTLVNESTVAVSQFSQVPTLHDEIKSRVEIGDELLLFNGKTFEQMMQEYSPITGGANHYGAQRSVLNWMSFQYGRTGIFNTDISVEYTLKKSNGTIYSVDAPVASRIFKPCITSNGMYSAADFHAVSRNPLQQYMESKKQLLHMSNDVIDEMNSLFPMVAGLNSTFDSILKYTIHDINGFKLGVIRLDSFNPRSSVEAIVLLIRDLLVDELGDTDSLLFDIRDNSGGSISLADSISQLFAPNVSPSMARVLVAETNEKIMLGSMFAGSDWEKAYKQVSQGDTYTKPVPFVTAESINTLGMAYLKPVGVLLNANCYSACELFAAQMQDNANALVFGEDWQSGGGGANVVEHGKYFSSKLPQVFMTLPNNQDMRLAWRQAVRVKQSQGKLIEDVGVGADYLVRPASANDQDTQFASIANILSQKSIETFKKDLHFKAEPLDDTDIPLGKTLNFKGVVQGFTRLQLICSNSILDTLELNKQMQEYQLSPRFDSNELGFRKYEIHGFSNETKVVETYRYLRMVPNPNSYLKAYSRMNYTWDFTSQSFIGLYNKQNAKEFGWQVLSNGIKLGDGSCYKENLDSSLSLFVGMPTGMQSLQLKVHGTFDTEQGFDYLIIKVVVPNHPDQFLFRSSGVGEIDEEFEISEYAGLDVELSFVFLSDGAVSGKGVFISEISLVSYF